jgi:hypothetical protein
MLAKSDKTKTSYFNLEREEWVDSSSAASKMHLLTAKELFNNLTETSVNILPVMVDRR